MAMPVRWRFFLVVFATAFLSYNLRQDIHVAAEYMMPELGLDEVQMGWIFASFIWGYTLFQLPGGILGRRVGARLLVSLLGVVWMLCAVLSGTLPGLLFSSTGAIIAGLCAVRFVVGAAHAPLFPVQAGLLEAWFPVGHWGLPNALQSAGLALGAAATQPLVA